MPGRSADRHRPAAQFRSRSTASPAVTATGTMFVPASERGMSSKAESRQQDRISAPVQSRSCGFRWSRIQPELPDVDLPDRLAFTRAWQVKKEHAVEALGSRQLGRQLRDVIG